MDIEYTQRLEKIEGELNKWLPAAAGVQPLGKEKMFPGIGRISDSLFEALFAPISDILSRGGKRWRPLLMTLVCETLGGRDAALVLAPLVEFCHNASLIHDDIEDNSDERRNKPAIHTIYGVDTAINSGAFFYFLSLCCIETLELGKKEAVYRIWAEYMRKLHLGQAVDISWHQDIKIIPGIDEYYAMCALKTGSLSRLAAELGAYSAGVDGDTSRQAGEAAEKLGIGFQILDDVKNLSTGIPGKKRGEDIVEGKKSLPLLLYLHKFPQKREQIFFFLYEAEVNGFAAPEVNEMIDTLTEAGVLKKAEEKAHSLINEARLFFNSPQYASIPADEKSRALLDGLIGSIL
jgi:octaprenyl-diphosphate synthase